MSKLTIAKILKPQGIRGELKIEGYTDDLARFKKLKKIYIGGAEYRLLSARNDQKCAYIFVQGIADRNRAELFRNKYIEIDREDVILPKNSFLIIDVLGSTVYDENGGLLGVVGDIKQGVKDLYTIKCANGKNAYFPLLKQMCAEMDIAGKKIVLKRKVFDEVVLYEE